jgi:uncharacterized LabA/DUF88 family protein
MNKIRNVISSANTEYLFIDAGYLRKVIEKKTDVFRVKFDLDLSKISRKFEKTFYYDAPKYSEIDLNQKSLDDFYKFNQATWGSLRKIDRFHVFTGTTKVQRKRLVQKQVDVMLAVHALHHAHRCNMTGCSILAGDADFIPLIDALVSEGIDVTLMFDKSSASEELINSADTQIEITGRWIWENCTDDFLSLNPGLMRMIQKDPNLDSWQELWRYEETKTILYQANAEVFIALIWSKSNGGQFEQIKGHNRKLIEATLLDEGKITYSFFNEVCESS